MSGFLQTTIGKIITVVAVLAIGNTVYQSFFSDKARAIKVLEEQIKQRDQQFKELSQQFEEITKREQQSLQKIAELKIKLVNVQDLITESEVDVDEIKNQLPDINTDLDFLQEFTTRTLESLDTGRGVLGRAGSGPGK